jgi:glycosyltransferase involved in cell wall biosynthesis
MTKNKKIALFLPSFAGGGAEKVMLILAEGFLNHDFEVDLIVANGAGPLRQNVDNRCKIFDLSSSGVIKALPGLMKYLKSNNPKVICSSQSHANVIALWAAKLARSKATTIVCEHQMLSKSSSSHNLKERSLPWFVRLTYRIANCIVAVSGNVAFDLSKVTQIPVETIKVINNPLKIAEIQRMSQYPPDHPWIIKKTQPVLIAIGRLHPVKDHTTLLRAFSKALIHRNIRLIILGEGKERLNLEKLIQKLNLTESVSMPGFVDNPYVYLRNADGFLISSLSEGLPLALMEALVFGLPIVSTACPGGLVELLEGNNDAMLVPVGDEDSFADAINKVLTVPVNYEKAKDYIKKFDIRNIIQDYIGLFNDKL